MRPGFSCRRCGARTSTWAAPGFAPAEQTFCDLRIGRDPLVCRLVQVGGIDSPGLPACLAIGREAADVVDAALDSGEDQR